MKSILVTGATGSFGNAFVRRLLETSFYERIVIFSRDELKQSVMRAELELESQGRLRWFIGDVRDYGRLYRALDGVDVVVHAAAMKQVPACEYNPIETVATNITGTVNIINASIDRDVSTVILISSDKAVAPVNLYGKTKAVAESLITQANSYAHGTRFACVRYGNVFGSRGSVIPLWESQLKTLGHVLTTDLKMTRFYLKLNTACDLVLDAIEESVGGEIFIPKTLSFSLGALVGAWNPKAQVMPIPIRPGEKMHEMLISVDESHRALDLGDRYALVPDVNEWSLGKVKGVQVPQGFYYASNHSPFYTESRDVVREFING